MKEFDSKTENGEIVVTKRKKRGGDELRLKFSDYASGKIMQEAIESWAKDAP